MSETLAGRARYIALHPLARVEQLGHGRTGIWDELLSTPSGDWYDLVRSEAASPEDWRSWPAGGACGFAFGEDTVLRLLDAREVELAANDDIDRDNGRLCSRISGQLTAGLHYLVVEGFGGGRNRSYGVVARSRT